MVYKKENSSLYIDIEAVSTLAMVKEGLFYPVYKLMNKDEAKQCDSTQLHNGKTFPFSFILAPSGVKNEITLKNAKVGDRLNLVCTQKHKYVGSIEVESIFKIDPQERVKNIFATYDMKHPGIIETLTRLGEYAISGNYQIVLDDIKKIKKLIADTKIKIGAQHTTAMMLAAKPFHRAHERVIRQSLEKSDLLIIFLLKPHKKDDFSYQLRKKTVEEFIDNYLPANRVIVVPFENTYLFAGNNEVVLNMIVSENFGCDSIIVGDNHAGLGLYYDNFVRRSVCDNLVGFNIDVQIVQEYVYCTKCTTIVSSDSCPHGDHYHIHYDSDSLVELLSTGILPPAVLVRKEVSATILSTLLPNRFNNLHHLYHKILPHSGIIEDHSEDEFYQELLKLYQTTSLT